MGAGGVVGMAGVWANVSLGGDADLVLLQCSIFSGDARIRARVSFWCLFGIGAKGDPMVWYRYLNIERSVSHLKQNKSNKSTFPSKQNNTYYSLKQSSVCIARPLFHLLS